MRYKDCNGDFIEYGDILKFTFIDYTKMKEPYAPRKSFGVFVKSKNDETGEEIPLIYVSGMNEYMPVEEVQKDDDAPFILSGVEIFAQKIVYDSALKFMEGGKND